MKLTKILLTAVCAVVFAAGIVSAQGTVSLETLLNDMIDRDAVARFPKTGFTVKQFSSYDHATTVKDGPGWFGNEDFNQFIRLETERIFDEWFITKKDNRKAMMAEYNYDDWKARIEKENILWKSFFDDPADMLYEKYYASGTGVPTTFLIYPDGRYERLDIRHDANRAKLYALFDHP